MKKIFTLFVLMSVFCSASAQITVTNPVLYSDVPDPDVICVDDCYYMVSTTAHMMPGAPIMRSYDMKHWEIISYVFDRLDESPAYDMNGGTKYSGGQWAASLRYNNGRFYVFFGTGAYSYLYSTDNPAGLWTLVKRFDHYYHDASILFEDNGRSFLVHCNNGEIYIKQFTADLQNFTDGNGLGTRIIALGDGALHEGVHAYKINGRYYMTTIWWPTGGNRTQLCFRSNVLTGPYEQRVILSDDGGYARHGIAQGGIWQAANGEWYAMLFQDHEAVGRVPWLLPCKWTDGWPVLGTSEGKAPLSFTIEGIEEKPTPSIVGSDDFDTTRLLYMWQWNHNPDNSLWSLSERPGWLRLKTGKVVGSIFDARNTLTMRSEGPSCTGTVKIDVSHMKSGDRAGLMMFCSEPGGLTVEQNGSQRSLVMTDRGADKGRVALTSDIVWLRAQCDFGADDALFYYSTDGEQFLPLGTRFHMVYTLVHFIGNKFAIFNYATQANGGYIDIDSFDYSRSSTDVSHFIKNPSFELGLDGWNNDGFQTQGNNAFSLKRGNNYAEKWISRGQQVGSATLTQTLNNLQKGRYVLRFVAQNIQEDAPALQQHGVRVLAEAQEIDVTIAQQYELPFTVIENTTPIGVEAESATGNWIAIDHFQLEYLGDQLGCQQEEMERRIAVAKDLCEKRMNKGTLTQLQNYLQRAEQATEASFSSAAAYLRIAIQAAQKSSQAYASLEDAIAKAEEMLTEDWKNGVEDLQDAIGRAQHLYEQDNASIVQLNQQVRQLEGAMLSLRLANGTGTPPVVTTDPRYARGNNRIFARLGVSGTGIIEEGFCYSTEGVPTIADLRANRWLDSGGRIYVIENLNPGTIYYIRAYAITDSGNIGYGDIVKAVTLPASNIRWSYENNGSPEENARINAGMEGWYYYWSQLTSINGYYPSVRIASGTPTADCSYGGWCQVGINAGFQQQATLTHEMLHGIGVGTHNVWWGGGGLRAGGDRGVWLGERVTELLTFWHNAYTVLDGDNTHMWPWGFNYASEDPHTEAGYSINAMLAQALGEDGLPPTGAGPTPYYAFPQEDGRKYYLTNEEANHGLGTAYLSIAKNGTIQWREATPREALENDSLAWYITFHPETSLYTFQQVATGRYMIYDGASFRLQSSASVPASGHFQMMRGRTDAVIRREGMEEVHTRGYWIIHPESRYDSPCLAAIDKGAVRSEGFDLGNWALTQRWAIFSTKEMLSMAGPATQPFDRIMALKVNNEPISDFQPDVFDYLYEIAPDNILSRYAVGADRLPSYNGNIRNARPTSIPGIGTSTLTDPDGETIVYTINFRINHAIHWHGDGATGQGSEPSRYGWGPRYDATWHPANTANNNAYVDPYEGLHTGFTLDEHPYNTRRMILLTYNQNDDTYTYTLSGLQPDSTYMVQFHYAWAEGNRIPELNLSVAKADSEEEIVAADFVPSATKRTLKTATLLFHTPSDATTDTDYQLRFQLSRAGNTLALARLLVTPATQEDIQTGIDDITIEPECDSLIYDLSGRSISTPPRRGFYIQGKKIKWVK